MIKDKNCKNDTYKMQELDQLIFDEIGKLALDKSYTPKTPSRTDDSKKKIKLLEKELGKIDSQRARFMDLYGLGTFSVEEIQSKIEPLNEQREKLEKEIKSLQEITPMSEDDAKRMLTNWNDILESQNHELIKSLIHALIDKIEIDGEDITIYWNFN